MHISGTPEPIPAVTVNEKGANLTATSAAQPRPDGMPVKPSAPPSQPALPVTEKQPASQVQQQSADKVNVAYRVDSKASQVYVQFVDATTGEVINQVPPPQVLAFEEQVSKLIDPQGLVAKGPAVSRPAGPAKKVE